ncbi:MAG: glycosyltransferase family 1 protein [Gaiellales bacterium]|nr:MAG: glycosyltransferase family 1 protein [Gaiellales bacterium]
MKIALVSEYYYPVLGGITEHVYHLASNLSRKGHDVTVITGRYVGRHGHHMPEEEGFRVMRLGVGMPVYSNGSFARVTLGRLGSRLRRVFDEERFDVIHAHSPLTPVLPLVAVRNSNALATVGTFHTYFDRSRGYDLFSRKLAAHMDMLDGRIVVSSTCIDAMSRYLDAEYSVIPNGVDTDYFTPELPTIGRFDDGKLNILFVGRFDPRNGLKTMLESFSLVKRELPDSRLIVVGDGPFRGYYLRLVGRLGLADVHFEGLVNGGRPNYYASADIYCSPCTKSSFGVVLLEAMAAAVPIVATDNNGYRSVMEHGRQGVLVPESDPRAFAEALLALARDPGLRSRMGSDGRRTAREQYSWKLVTDAVEDYYRNLLDPDSAAAPVLEISDPAPAGPPREKAGLLND